MTDIITTSNSPAPKLSFQAIHIEKNLYRIDVLFENIPKNFLGTAFNVTINPEGWTYKNFKLGNIFENPENVMALISPPEKSEGKIIFGVTLKRGFSITTDRGILASFDINFSTAPKMEIKFEKGIISILSNGKRRDITSTIWENGTFNFQKTGSSKGNEVLETSLLKPGADSPMSEGRVVNASTLHPMPAENQEIWIGFFFLAFIGMTAGLIFIRKKFMKPKN